MHTDENLIRAARVLARSAAAAVSQAFTVCIGTSCRYRKLALQLHPDKCSHQYASEAMQALNKAFSIIMPQDDRYTLARAERPHATCDD